MSDSSTTTEQSLSGEKGRLFKLRKRYQRYIDKIGGALTDQVLFTGGNFVINVLLARWLGPDKYGAFTVAFAWFLLAVNLYEALLVEPMSYFGSGKYAEKFKSYIAIVFFGHLGVSSVVAILLAVGALITLFLDSSTVAGVMLGFAIAAPFILLRRLVRNPFYIVSTPYFAAFGNLLYFIVVLALLIILYLSDMLTATSAVIIMAFGGLFSGLILMQIIKPDWKYDSSEIRRGEVIRDHWQYGRWSTTFRFLSWVNSNMYYLILPVFGGLAASAGQRVLINLVQPFYMAIAAMSSVLLPSFVRTYRHHGAKGLKKRVINVILLGEFFAISYFVFLTLFGGLAVNLLYGGEYDDLVTTPILITLGLIPVMMIISFVINVALRAVGRVNRTVYGKIVPTMLTATLGVYLTIEFGLLGSNSSNLIAQTLTTITQVYFFYSWYKFSSDTNSEVVPNK